MREAIFSTSRAPALVAVANLCSPHRRHIPTSHNNVSFCRRSQAWVSCSHLRSSYKVAIVCAHCRINCLQQTKRCCSHCGPSQSFCAYMGPPLGAASSASPPCNKRKLRALCLHGFRTNGKIMETQLAKLDRSAFELLDLVFLDGFFPAEGKSDVVGLFKPPFYEWFQFEWTEAGAKYRNLNECVQSISSYMERNGPFDGIIGFSQGACLAAALAGMQQQGLTLTSSPALCFVVIISGGLLIGEHPWKGCYSKPIRCPSVHLIGTNDFLKPESEELLLKFEDPIVVRHMAKHTVPPLAICEDVINSRYYPEVIKVTKKKKKGSKERYIENPNFGRCENSCLWVHLKEV